MLEAMLSATPIRMAFFFSIFVVYPDSRQFLPFYHIIIRASQCLGSLFNWHIVPTNEKLFAVQIMTHRTRPVVDGGNKLVFLNAFGLVFSQ